MLSSPKQEHRLEAGCPSRSPPALVPDKPLIQLGATPSQSAYSSSATICTRVELGIYGLPSRESPIGTAEATARRTLLPQLQVCIGISVALSEVEEGKWLRNTPLAVCATLIALSGPLEPFGIKELAVMSDVKPT